MVMVKIFFILIICLLPACSTVSYYSQSVQGQMSLLFGREPIEDVIANPNSSQDLKRSLQQAQSIRQYASDKLALPNNKSYQYYADVERPYVVWNVFAAPEFSLEPTRWCYPIVGCVSYRGYFAKEDAEQEAILLKQQNLDVHVGGIAAYSTLGWFDDPLLNTMLHWKERSLAGLIFHELSHQVIYIKNETAFNEAFSSSVERLGTIQWLIEFHPDQLQNYLSYLNAQSDFRELLLSTRTKLNTLYEQTMEETEKRREKQKIISQMTLNYEMHKKNWPQGIHFDGWFKKTINNARLTSAMTYLQKIPAFYAIFIEQEGNWKQFYKTVLALEELSSTERKNLILAKMQTTIDYSSLVDLIAANVKQSRSNDLKLLH